MGKFVVHESASSLDWLQKGLKSEAMDQASLYRARAIRVSIWAF